jgi:hypothetical protein
MKKITIQKAKTVKAVATPKAAAAPVPAPAPVTTPVAAPAIAAAFVKPAEVAPVKKPAVRTTRTSIVAKIDIGFGNALYIRGEGPGLSWDKGLVMDCVADSEWTATISDALSPIVFKFLVNDITWCAGNDYSVEPGGSITIEPTF